VTTIPVSPTIPAVPAAAVAPADTKVHAVSAERATPYVWAAARLMLGWTFLWPFLDKTFGWHHQTASAKAWIHGGSPTTGFLKGAAGPLAGFYHGLAGSQLADWGFMIGLLCIGVALLTGIGVRVAAISGAVMLVLMWSASFPPADNPFMDEHLIYAVVLVALALARAGAPLGLGARWAKLSVVRNHSWLV
jgi:thiosulfate dehydrogenase [quinone] large subunit